MKLSIQILLLTIFLLCSIQEIRFNKEKFTIIQSSLLAQDNASLIWSDIPEISFSIKGDRRILPLKYRTVKVQFNHLNDILRSAPFEFSDRARTSPLVIELPTPDGTMSKFFVTEYSMMEQGLASQYPEIKTFNLKGIDDPYATGKFDITMFGFHAMVLTPNGDYFIDPYSSEEKEIYISYYKSDFTSTQQFECLVNEEQIINDGNGNNSIFTGQQLRTYRLACAATGEYTAFYGGTVSAGQAAIVTAINRVNGVYERDASVRMTLVANNTSIVYTNAATDPYTNNNGFTMLGQNQTNLTNVIGSANYDIGHVFSTGGGGVAGLGVVCNSSQKARGVTGLPSPIGDPFYIDYVAHEMGHQYSGNHTFNGSGCGGTNGSTAWEPGSGSTIMAYAGICGSDDLQSNSDDYFHSGSVSEITNFTQFGTGNSCAVITNTGNTPPSVTVPAGGFTIPINTPFELTGSATDVENPGSLTYCWEQFDTGPSGPPNSPTGNAPIFRSFSPVTSPSRTFPKLSNLLNNTQTIGEILPSYTRNLSFRLTVRDNNTGGGGINFSSISFAVSSTGGAFTVTQPNTNVNWNAGVPQTVTWNAGSTASAPYNVTLVNIKLSTNGGNTFATTLLANTPNDGSQSVTLPNLNISNARIKVEAVGNIFFDISNTNFTISPTVLPTITHTPLTDMTKQNWPATVTANVTSGSPLDSVWVVWYINSAVNLREFDLPNISGNTYSAPFNSLNSDVAVDDFIYYRIFAQNNSPSHEKDSTVLYSFKIIDGTLCQAFTSTTFPPSGWSIQFPVMQNYWVRSGASAYGVGNGSARFAFWNAPVDTTQSMVTHTFINTIAGDSLKFDNAYAPFSEGTDSLRIETSTDGGASYTVLERFWGDEVSGIGGNSLNTRATFLTQYISPASNEWISRKFALPVGTNKIKFRARSGSGNNLFLDNICISTFIAAVPATITLAPQGFYNTSTLRLNINDTVDVYLRNTTIPFGIVDSGKAVIDSVTLTGSLTFNAAPTGTYYVVVRHRSSIETWSKSGGESYVKGAAFNYDFTSAVTQAFGDNLILRGSLYCIYSGDVNQDYGIDLSDLAEIDNAVSTFTSGYVTEDLNGDYFVDLADYTFADNNAFNFVTRIAPPGAALSALSKGIKTVPK